MYDKESPTLYEILQRDLLDHLSSLDSTDLVVDEEYEQNYGENNVYDNPFLRNQKFLIERRFRIAKKLDDNDTDEHVTLHRVKPELPVSLSGTEKDKNIIQVQILDNEEIENEVNVPPDDVINPMEDLDISEEDESTEQLMKRIREQYRTETKPLVIIRKK